ncbi:hypothetical protein LTR56_007358 [Elasticomyces elasticus]|nr:hypothetical protein LTR56_007358 [Elasticomyces elasticus]KAK3668099.1 hypothetical protein LTR22_001170 [Elasticomyces elasticus]KAK4925247.1 hypothetical protein LTR49_007788 [Elasticomyces elasticus]KAK5767738.1 hypothetical protein LTS12_002243 [Elasticomyces elasticus]
MATTQPDADTVARTTSTEPTLLTSTSRGPSTASTKIPTTSSTPSSSSHATTSAIVATSTASSSISWGPAITASPMPNISSAVPEPSGIPQSSQTNTGFSKSAKHITIATTVIGGVLVLLLLVYAIRQRRRGATLSDIAHFRPHPPSTIMLSPSIRDARLTALPIYRETRYSVRSSQHASMASVPRSPRGTALIPPKIAQKFHSQNPYVKDSWKTAHPPSPLRDAQSSRPDDTAIRNPAKAHLAPDTVNWHSSMAQRPRAEHTKSWLRLSVEEEGPLSDDDASPPSPHKASASIELPQDRWSWTNSQAPATPRYRSSMRSSISSLPRFRNIKSWARGQGERIDEERPPVPPVQDVKRSNLKNKAAMPKLAPPPKRKPSKTDAEHARIGSLSSITQQAEKASPRIA